VPTSGLSTSAGSSRCGKQADHNPEAAAIDIVDLPEIQHQHGIRFEKLFCLPAKFECLVAKDKSAHTINDVDAIQLAGADGESHELLLAKSQRARGREEQ